MPLRTKALALLGAVATAGGAYALGSATGGGSAEAARSARAAQAPRPVAPGECAGGARDLSATAKKLGVSEAKLRAALKSVRQSVPRPERDGLAKDLAAALNIDTAKVTSAFQSLKGDGPRVRPEPPSGPPPGDDGSAPDKPPAPPAEFLAALAKKLGVSEADLKAAIEKVRTNKQAERKARSDEFVTKLADALGVDKAKVATVFPEGPRGGFGFRRGFRHGFGPGGFAGPPPGGPPPGDGYGFRK